MVMLPPPSEILIPAPAAIEFKYAIPLEVESHTPAPVPRLARFVNPLKGGGVAAIVTVLLRNEHVSQLLLTDVGILLLYQ